MNLILFLDDDPDRHYLVDEYVREMVQPSPPRLKRKHANDYRLDHAWSAEEAMSAIDHRRYDVAFLDYDLDAFVPGASNGMAVVEYIVALPARHRPRNVVVHSLNPGTAPQRMMDRLRGQVGGLTRAPFGSSEMVDDLWRCVNGLT